MCIPIGECENGALWMELATPVCGLARKDVYTEPYGKCSRWDHREHCKLLLGIDGGGKGASCERSVSDPHLLFWSLADIFVGNRTIIVCNMLATRVALNPIYTSICILPKMAFITTTFLTSLTTCYNNGSIVSFLSCFVSFASAAGDGIQIIIVQFAALGVQLGKVGSGLGGGHFHASGLGNFQQLLSGSCGFGLFYQLGGGGKCVIIFSPSQKYFFGSLIYTPENAKG